MLLDSALSCCIDFDPEGDEETRYWRVAGGVSIVVPARNVAETLPDQLSALLGQMDASCDEIVVADNGSSDRTAVVVKKFQGTHPNIRLVAATGRQGINHARNVGVMAARNEKILFCDGDDVVALGWLEAMGRTLHSFDAAGGRTDLLALNGERERRWRGAVSDPRTELVDGFLTRPVGANCGVRRSTWEQLGGFDEEFILGGDETDFFWRLQLAGHQWAYVDSAVVHYRLRRGLRSLARQYYLYGRARPLLYRKFREHGMAPSTLGAVLGTCWHLVTSAPAALIKRGESGRLVRDCAFSAGKVVGSIKYRSFYL